MKSYAEARDNILQELELPKCGQSWSAELPWEYRSTSLLSRVLAAVDVPRRDLRERQLLIELALDLADDLIDEPGFEELWSKIVQEIRARPDLHVERVVYWSCDDEPGHDGFKLTPYVRAILPTR